MTDRNLIYFAARGLPPGNRAAYLITACGGDHELRARLEQMLAVADEAEAFITDVPDDGSAKILKLDVEDAPDEAVGQMIGRYKLLERVGEGGCGAVYVAEQTEPVRRRVALKVIKLGMDTKQVVARFEAERQALAMMDHPNIAKVLDAGTTDVGRPYFVMELVRGNRITDYCDQANRTTKERLDLFIKVCQAIQHAHQKGIIHRDIKPSNILVTLHDGVPVPKVIDFGIAKATEGRLTDATVYTQLHQFIGTPAYMSPEQAEMSGLDIDTRSDIYSLGVLLYELLAGSTPFDAKELMASGIDAMRKTIREKEPVRPSTRLATLKGEELTTTAKRRSADAPKLIHLLQGDLDWIVMKCLEKDRTRRYETANGLAADLTRHLSHEPVVARPPSAAYKFQKAWKRNRVAFTAGAVVVGALVVGISISVWQAAVAIRAKNQAVIAEAGKEQEARIAKQERDAAKAATLQAERERSRADEQAESNRRSLYAADMLAAQIAERRLNYGATRRLLNRHVPGANRQDLRGFEWRLLWQQSRGDQLRTLKEHSDVVVRVAFSPDGKYLLSGSRDGTVVVWDVSSGRKLNSWVAHKSGVNSVSFSPDAKLVATGGGSGSIKLWEWPEMILQTTFTNLGGYAEFDRVNMRLFTGFGPNFMHGGVYGEDPKSVALVNLLSSTGPERVVQLKTAKFAFAVASPQGDLVAVGSRVADVQLLDLDGHLLLSLDESKGAQSLAFSPKAALLAICSGNWGKRPENEIRVHDTTTGRRLVSLTNHTGQVWSLDFSPDGRWLASASSDQTVRLWDAATWREADRFQGHGSEVWSVAFSPDGELVASGGRDATVRLWKADRADSANRVDDARVNYGYNLSPRFLNRESMFAAQLGSNRMHPGIWSVPSGKLLHEFPKETACLGENAQGTAIITMRVFKPIFLRFWDPHDFHLLKEVALLTVTNGLRTATNQTLVFDASLSSDRRSVLVGQPGRALEVDCETGQTGKEISLPGMGVFARFSPDRSFWAAIGGSTDFERDYRMGATAKSSRARFFTGHQDQILRIAFSPTENIVATASIDNTARLWEWPSGQQLAVLAGHKGGLFYCDFSPDGKTLATASSDKTVKLWHVSTRREVMTLEHDHAVTVCVFSPEGNYLATGTVDGTYHFWPAATLAEIPAAEAGEVITGRSYAQAELVLSKLLANARKSASTNSSDLELQLAEMAELRYRQKRYADAEALYRERCETRLGHPGGQTNSLVVDARVSLGRLYTDWAWAERASAGAVAHERAIEGEKLLRENIPLREADAKYPAWRRADLRSRLGGALSVRALTDSELTAATREPKLVEAEAILQRGQDGMEQDKKTETKYRRDGIERFIRLYEAWPKPDQLAEWKQKLAAFDENEATKN